MQARATHGWCVMRHEQRKSSRGPGRPSREDETRNVRCANAAHRVALSQAGLLTQNELRQLKAKDCGGGLPISAICGLARDSGAMATRNVNPFLTAARPRRNFTDFPSSPSEMVTGTNAACGSLVVSAAK